MGHWRHFGEHLELAAAGCGAVGDVAPAFRDQPLAWSEPVRPLPDVLARVIEGEILPRLMLAHRPGAGRRAPADRAVTPQEIAAFSTLLLAPGPVDLDGEIAALRDGGLPLARLLLDLLAPAARHLGALWEEDACDFLAVTEALGRLQAISRHLCLELESEAAPVGGRSVLLLPCPGETHRFGLSVVASFFREAGWDVTTAVPAPGLDPLALLATDWFEVVGLSLSCDVLLPALSETVAEVRRASRNPGVRILVGGPYFARHGGEASIVGADACALDACSAPAAAEALLDRRALAC
ncbi:cobalamin B12-binding domain-containing protein [Methylobacterium sp. 2A]|jgi:methanogenic corrinoid protein MtbC1|uniref:cobalamin B12-binding domain-containing protein n=1 Tax=Methylobacterium sp. 2A TaxID=2603816 RepID=UPI001353FCD4|nr:cobalamin B12-binding domain-containing protein [Methylobacterium sp. 2A]MWV21105.1 cobalamin B12-binding domain-containing protein [Methylobacterium sp. 2A]